MLLFVYGTLRSGFDNTFRRLMVSQSTFLCMATIQGQLYDLGTYPGLILSDDDDARVVGELYQLHHPALIKELDLYENYRSNDLSGSLYIRREEMVLKEDGSTVKAVVYTYNKSVDEAVMIERGDYILYLDENGE